MSLQLIAGYTLSGKSTMSRADLVALPYAQHHRLLASEATGYRQLIYARPGGAHFDAAPVLSGLLERPLAASLKEMTHERLGLQIPIELWDTVKDAVLVRDPDDGGTLHTIRHYYLKYGAEACAGDPAVWVRKTLAAFDGTSHWSLPDWRKPLEYAFIRDRAAQLGVRLTTYRIFRSAVPVPGPNSPLEHDLDDTETDMLCVQSTEDFVRACEIFPQYKQHVPAWIAVTRDVAQAQAPEVGSQ